MDDLVLLDQALLVGLLEVFLAVDHAEDHVARLARHPRRILLYVHMHGSVLAQIASLSARGLLLV